MRAQILLKFSIGKQGQGCLAAEITEDRPELFTGEVLFAESPSFPEAVELLGGSMQYPQDLEKRGFDVRQTAALQAGLWLRMPDGSFGLTISFGQIWRATYGQAEFAVTALKGQMRYAGREQGTYTYALTGEMVFAGCRAEARLSLGSADVPTLLQLTAGSKNAFSLEALTDGITGDSGYRKIPLPDSYERPQQMFLATASLNLSEGSFLLRGEYQAAPRKKGAAMLCFTANAQKKEGHAYCLMASVQGFTLADISPALQGADEFLGLSDVSAAVILANCDQTIPGLLAEDEGELLPAVGSVRNGLTLQAKLRLSGTFLPGILSLKGVCMLAGYIPKENGKAVELAGRLERITFLEILTLSEVEVNLRKGKGLFFLHMQGEIELSFEQLGKLPRFTASLTVERMQETDRGQTGLWRVKLTGGLAEPLVHPLGIPGTAVEELGFTAISEERSGGKEKQLYFFGVVSVGGVSLDARILFADMKPAVVAISVAADKPISIKGLVETYTDWQWPKLLNIELSDGRIWYCRNTVTLREGQFEEGFHARVHTKISLLPTFVLSVSLRESMLVASAQLEQPADFFFIRFSLKSADDEKVVSGPKLSIISCPSATVFTLSSDIELFSRKIANVAIEAKRDCLRGKLAFPKGFILPEELGFSLDKNGIHLDECSISGFDRLKFHIPEFKMGSPKCGLHMKEGFNLKVSPRVKSTGILMDGDTMGISYEFQLAIRSEAEAFRDDPYVTLSFQNLSLKADKKDFKSFDFDCMIELVGKNIVSAAEKMFEQVVNGEFTGDKANQENLKKLAYLLTVEGATWAASELIDYLVCQGLKDALAKSFTAALTAAAETFWEGLGKGLGFSLGGIFLTEVAEGIFKVRKKSPGKGGKKPVQPGTPALSFADNRLSIVWQACQGADNYLPVILRQKENGESVGLTVGVCSSTSKEIRGTMEESPHLVTYGHTYQVQICAYNDNGMAEGPAASIYLPACPQWSSYFYDCAEETLHFAWRQIEKVTGYELELSWEAAGENEAGGSGEEKRKVRRLAPSETAAVFLQVAAPRRVTVRLRCLADCVSGPEIQIGPWYLYDLAVPAHFRGRDEDGGIYLCWDGVEHALSYRVFCRDAAGNEISLSDTAACEILVPADKLSADAAYIFRVQALRDEIRGRLSGEVAVTHRMLPVPVIQELICKDDGCLLICFSDGTDRYTYLRSADGGIVSLGDGEALFESRISEDGLSLRLLAGARRGAWCPAVSVLPVPPPGGLEAVIADGRLSVTWQAKSDMDYGLELVAEGWQKKAEPLQCGLWETAISALPKGRRIYLSLYAIDRADRRRRSVAVEHSFEI